MEGLEKEDTGTGERLATELATQATTTDYFNNQR